MKSRCAAVGGPSQRSTTLRRRSSRDATSAGAHGRVGVVDALGVLLRAAQRDRDRVSFDGRPQGTAPGAQGDGVSDDWLERRAPLGQAGLAPSRGATARRSSARGRRRRAPGSRMRRADDRDSDRNPASLGPAAVCGHERAHQTRNGSIGECGGDEQQRRGRCRRLDVVQATSTAKPKQSASAGAAASAYVPLIVSPSVDGIRNREEEDRSDGGNGRQRGDAAVPHPRAGVSPRDRGAPRAPTSARAVGSSPSDALTRPASRRSHRFGLLDRAPTTRCRSSRPTSRRRAPARSGRRTVPTTGCGRRPEPARRRRTRAGRRASRNVVRLRAVEDRVRIPRRLVHVPRCGNEHRQQHHDRERRQHPPAERPIGHRDDAEDDDGDRSHPERPRANELAEPRSSPSETASHQAYRRARTMCARTRSAPAVTSIPSGSGWNIAPAFTTVGRKAKKAVAASQTTGRAGQSVRARRRTSRQVTITATALTSWPGWPGSSRSRPLASSTSAPATAGYPGGVCTRRSPRGRTPRVTRSWA